MKYFFVILIGILYSFNSIAQCDQPSSLEANNITSSSADLAWTAGGDELYWALEWGNDGFVLGEGIYIDSIDSPEYFLTDLDFETSYDYYVWALCEEDTSSQAALEFITLPKNNATCDAILIEVDSDSATTVDNTNAIPYGPDGNCWGEHSAGDLWYVFELTEASGIEIITESGISADSHIALYQISGCEEDSVIYTQLYCSEDIDGTDWMSYIITEELAAGEYYIQCGTWYNAIGDYTIWVNSAEPIVYPTNNECEGATIHTVSVNGLTVTVNGNGLNATDENFMGSPHVWEAFSLDSCADVRIDFCGSTVTPVAIFTNLYANCPTESPFQTGSFVSDVCVDDNNGIQYTSLPAGTYYYPVIADSTLGGYDEYTFSISADSCTVIEQPDTCTTWINGPYGDFNSLFGGAPSPDTLGNCQIYSMDTFPVYASESYDVDNFQESIEYHVGICFGTGAGSWPVELAILDTLGNIIAWSDTCRISFIAPYTGRFTVGINEAGACGSTSSNTSTGNGFLSISCGVIVLDLDKIPVSDFSVYPNPSSGIINIQNNSVSAEYRISLIDISGKVMYSKEWSLLDNETKSIKLPDVSKGLYLLKMINLENQSYSISRLILE